MRIIVTGGNSGVGKATATVLAGAGHTVVIAGRDIPKAERAAAEMTGDVEVAQLDLADLASVRKFADSVETVDVLVNNAGIMGLPLTRTADGFEALMGTNYPFRTDLPPRRQDQRPGGLGDEHEPLVQQDVPRRPELAHPHVLEVGSIWPVQAGDHAFHI